MVLGTAADDEGERQADDHGDHPGAERGRAPAEGLQRPGDERHRDAAERERERHGGECAGAPALEPVDERDVDREEAAQARAEGDDDERGVEGGKRVGEAEQHQAAAEHDHADADDALRAEAVDDPAENGAEDRHLHLLQRRRARERGLAPAALFLQHRDVGAEGLRHQRRLEKLQAGAGADHVPSVEDLLQGCKVKSMSISMYQASAPRFARLLRNLSAILAKAQAHVEAKKLDAAALTGFRLFPDMFTLTRQVQIACDQAKGAVARLAGAEPPKHEDTEQSFADLQARIAKTLDFVESMKPAQIDGSETREVVLKQRTGELRLKGLDYLFNHAYPNFYFHLTTAYNILRHNGVELGKKDFIGSF